ncbi:uncharacterized protein NECHADRAFT_75850 [Fusarium vanettenii 77-13-4]|uniref:Xylanolytic transcriptional activator regulatory domain-containing protein n=1 Tax=Fusarium vanettenii (strain ATCC MYA-4622 / CBS 123669 / FGSC 9596 / NRRL 45880 / 77-13-4) TaxID=660122 RepID=C7Z5S3_FUSV7|nr:uncharacterized protein NECHADRAFT_75850 [Fusarium vanettenii 77-13-4]EEU40572.1 hypothetical protein NECHADRAFT_75850 [Fusarium vanettenii 77-13-4]
MADRAKTEKQQTPSSSGLPFLPIAQDASEYILRQARLKIQATEEIPFKGRTQIHQPTIRDRPTLRSHARLQQTTTASAKTSSTQVSVYGTCLYSWLTGGVARMLRLVSGYTGEAGVNLGAAWPEPDKLVRTANSYASSNDTTDSEECNKLPGFIKPMSSCIDRDDVAYLRSKGALSAPNVQLQNALLWSFFEYVYPFIPVVDVEEFLSSVHDRDGNSGQISLLLYHAVLFAGTAHVNMDLLKKSGFKTRREARKAFFHRVRLLYDFNAESDRVVIIQALLLMTLWYETPNEHRNTWHWIDVAISQAFAAGLHRDPPFLSSPPLIRIQRLRRRIWWTCLMRDRLVSLGMKRPPRINDEDYCVTMLEEADFGPADLPETERGQLRDMCSYIQDNHKRMALARLCIAKASLCRRLRYYLRSRYSVFAENAGDEAAEAFTISRPDDKAAYVSCSEDLVAWQKALSNDCKYRTLSSDLVAHEDRTVALHRTILHMIYYASISGIHRSRFTLLLHDKESSLFDQEVSKIWMQHAAIRVSDMAGEIHQHGLDGLLPTLGLSVVVSAASVHLLEIRGVIDAERKRAHEGYRRCMVVLDSLADMYVAADLAKDAMEWAFVQPSARASEPSDEVESLVQSSQSPTLGEAPVDIDSLINGNRQGCSAPTESVEPDHDDMGLGAPGADFEDVWMEYPMAEMDRFENTVMFSDIDL